MHADVQSYLDRMLAATAKAGRVQVWPAAHHAAEVPAKIADTLDPKAEVLLWASNSRTPMADLLAAWYFLGVISEAQVDATMAENHRQTVAFLAEYRAAQPAQPSAEERYEARAAFGPSAPTWCKHCERTIVLVDGVWSDLEAQGDDEHWRVTCDAVETFTAEHEPMVPARKA